MSTEVVQTGVNVGAGAPPTPATQVPVSNPPASEQPAATTPVDNKVPYTRFQEVIHQKNEIAQKLEDLEKRLQTQEITTIQKAKVDSSQKYIQSLTARGMDEQVAQLIVDTASSLTKEQLEQRVAPLEKASLAQQIDAWTDKFAKEHKDYNELSPEMHRVFEALPEHNKQMIASSPMGLEFLYDHVKVQQLEKSKNESFQKGAEQAYATKGMKQAVSSTTGASANPPVGVTRKDVGGMGLKEYEKRREEIFEALLKRKPR